MRRYDNETISEDSNVVRESGNLFCTDITTPIPIITTANKSHSKFLL